MTGFLAAQTRGLAGEVVIEIDDLDPANHLPACDRLTAFLPNGQRAWGHVSIGVTCEQPATWTAYVSARVRVLGHYLVLARALRPGQIVGPDDIERRSGDLTTEGDGALVDSTQAIGHPARIAVAAGQPLKREMLRIPPAVRRGQQVRVVTGGSGFEVSSEGRAMNDAAPGELVRVRLKKGRVLSGQARADGSIEISP